MRSAGFLAALAVACSSRPGASGHLVLDPSYDFGVVPINADRFVTLTAHNEGSGTIQLTSFDQKENDAAFKTSFHPRALAGGDSVGITVFFGTGMTAHLT